MRCIALCDTAYLFPSPDKVFMERFEATQSFLNEVIETVQRKFRNVDDEYVSICNERIAKIYPKLCTLENDLHRLRYAITACIHAIMNYRRSESIRHTKERESASRKPKSYLHDYDLALGGYYETA